MFFTLQEFSVVQRTKLKLIPFCFSKSRSKSSLHHNALNCEGLERAGYFLLLTTADALIWARIWSRIGLPPSWALPNSRLIRICPKLLKCMFWSGGLRIFSTSSAEKTPHCTERRSLRDRLRCTGTSREYVAKRHGEKNPPPHRRIQFTSDVGLSHNEGQLTFNCPEKQKLDLLGSKKCLFCN